MSKAATVHAQQKWQYMEISRKTEGYLVNELNQLGEAGWELVSVSYHKDTKSGLGSAESWTAFLKRPQSHQARNSLREGKVPGAASQPQPAPEPDDKPPDDKPPDDKPPDNKPPDNGPPDETPEVFDFQD